MRPVLTALALVALSAAPALAAAPDVAGTYQVRGWNPGTSMAAKASYGGSLTLAHKGDLITATWSTGGPEVTGVGLVSEGPAGRILSLSYIEAGHPAIAVYTISADGKQLEGRWGAQGVGHELATR